MGWKDQNGNPVTDPGVIQQLELAEQGIRPTEQGRAGMQAAEMEALQTPLTDPVDLLTGAYGALKGAPAALRGAGVIGRGLLAGAKAVRNKLFGTPADEAVGSFLQNKFGFPATAGERIATTRPGIQEAYSQIGGQPNVPINNVVKSVDQSLQTEKFASNPNENAIKYLTNLRAKYQNGPDALYTDLVDESQALRREALKYRGDPATQNSFFQAKEGLDRALANISPAAKEAALKAKQGAALPKLSKAIHSNDPALQLENLFQKEPSMAQAFGYNSPQEIQQLLTEARMVPLSQDPSAPVKFIQKVLGHAPWMVATALGAGLGTAGGLYGYHRYGGR